VRQIIQFKRNCHKLSNLFNEIFYNQQRSLGDFFKIDDQEESSILSNPNWVAGTLIPPTTNLLILPASIVTSSTINSPNRSNRSSSLKYDKVTLDDGTEVTSKFNKNNNHKRNPPEEAGNSREKNSKH
jgi:hypothetical protein